MISTGSRICSNPITDHCQGLDQDPDFDQGLELNQDQNQNQNQNQKSIRSLVFQNLHNGNLREIVIDCQEDQIHQLSGNHELINILVNDCQDQDQRHRLDLMVPDQIEISHSLVQMVLFSLSNDPDHACPERMRTFYDSLILMDYLMSHRDIGLKVRESFDKIFSPADKSLDQIQPDTENILYSMGTFHKLHGYIDHRLINKLSDVNSMQLSIELAIKYKFDDKFIVLLFNLLKEKINMVIRLNESENQTATQRFKFLFNDLIQGLDLDLDRFVIAGGSVNICLDQRIGLTDQTTDLDIFLIGDTMVQKQTLRKLLDHFIKKFGADKIYISDSHWVKYLWFADQPYHVQIIGTMHCTGYQVVNYFDLTHVKCWYDGKDFYKTPDCDLSLRSKVSYALIQPLKKQRIYKTINRGYRIINVFQRPCFPDGYMDSLTDHKVLDYVSEEVEIYKYQIKNYHNFLPKSANCLITNKTLLGFLAGKKMHRYTEHWSND